MSDLNIKNIPTLKQDAAEFAQILADMSKNLTDLNSCVKRMGGNWSDQAYDSYRGECDSFRPLAEAFIGKSEDIHRTLDEHIRKCEHAANTKF